VGKTEAGAGRLVARIHHTCPARAGPTYFTLRDVSSPLRTVFSALRVVAPSLRERRMDRRCRSDILPSLTDIPEGKKDIRTPIPDIRERSTDVRETLTAIRTRHADVPGPLPEALQTFSAIPSRRHVVPNLSTEKPMRRSDTRHDFRAKS